MNVQTINIIYSSFRNTTLQFVSGCYTFVRCLEMSLLLLLEAFGSFRKMAEKFELKGIEINVQTETSILNEPYWFRPREATFRSRYILPIDFCKLTYRALLIISSKLL